MSAKPDPCSIFSAAFCESRRSCSSSSSSNFLRRRSSSLKPLVTNVSQSWFLSLSFFSKRSSTICCSTRRRSVAMITFSTYLASRLEPARTASDPSRTVRPTRFFCISAAVRTACEPRSSSSPSFSPTTSSYWKMLGSCAARVSAARCACNVSALGLAQSGRPRALPVSSSCSRDSAKRLETPAFACCPLARAAALGGLDAVGAPGREVPAPKPKPLNCETFVFSGPVRNIAALVTSSRCRATLGRHAERLAETCGGPESSGAF
mmetsp:Transcript_58830/g.164279  ORF Transcript_58830/g.164279 Transcript_58830/m.164279 type:complete len:264 (+) Transcript_58830:493-1284(+)